MPACPSCNIGLTMLVALRGIFDAGAPLLTGLVVLAIVTTIVLTIQKLGLVATSTDRE